MIVFASCKVDFYKLNIYDVNFTNYYQIAESNLRKLCEKTILIKWILTLDNLNTHHANAIETLIKTFYLLNASSCKNSIAISYNNYLMYHDHLVSFKVWVTKSKF